MTEEERLLRAVDRFSDLMKDRLLEKLEAGFTGWDDTQYRDSISWNMFDKAVAVLKERDSYVSGRNCVDIANFAMMIFIHEGN